MDTAKITRSATTRPNFRSLPERATRLAVSVPRDRLDPAVVRWAESASRRTPWAIAFSGGPDSLALLLLIWAHWPEHRRTLRVLHFNHRLRGAESRADAAFCRRVATALGVTFVGGEWREARAGASEAGARAVRMAFLEQHARVVWLGHQQDDIAETMLMRIARGSGTGGLAAPRPVQLLPRSRVHLRPLLTLKKDEIVAALREAGIAWRDDSSNAGEHFFRNRIRRKVLPLWAEAAQRDAVGGAARSRLLLEEDDTALEAWLDALRPLGKRHRLALGPLEGKPRALWRRALHRWLMVQPRAGEISRAAFDALLAAIERGKRTRHSLGRHGFAVTDGREVWFEPMRNKHRKFLGYAN
ncbi:MAG: tRNA lysidine(34) synthetase TilS [Opitutaceae bacterium]